MSSFTTLLGIRKSFVIGCSTVFNTFTVTFIAMVLCAIRMSVIQMSSVMLFMYENRLYMVLYSPFPCHVVCDISRWHMSDFVPHREIEVCSDEHH